MTIFDAVDKLGCLVRLKDSGAIVHVVGVVVDPIKRLVYVQVTDDFPGCERAEVNIAQLRENCECMKPECPMPDKCADTRLFCMIARGKSYHDDPTK